MNKQSKNSIDAPINESNEPGTYRSIWISDVHLGSVSCKAELLANFLKHNQCDKLYLVGDIIDGWRLKKNFYWPQAHTNVVRKVLTKSKRGTQVVYVAGNHDEFLRKFVDHNLTLGNIKVVDECIHETADGRKLLITHGDMFDIVTRYHRSVAFAGDKAYDMLVWANGLLNKYRAKNGMPYWSLAAYAKQKVKTAVNFIFEFEDALAHECRKREMDGVICGHIHHPEIKDIDGVTYHNCGDWVESCTALAEHEDGRIEIIRWGRLYEKPAAKPNSQSTVVSLDAAA